MKRLLCLALGLALTLPAFADEGMWMPQQLPDLQQTLKAEGLKLNPENLTDLTQYPMNAVISLGGCTASFVSPQGLVITNHHCAFNAIQYNSTEKHDYLADGFIARKKGDELYAGPGSRIYVTEDVRDVSDVVKSAVPDGAVGKARFDAISQKEKDLVAACEKTDGYRCSVHAYYGGLNYYLIKQLEIRDVRLVYAPPKGIGKFGGDVDNWMWPRHTGDYSFYRAYVGPDGKPADYSKDNVPYHPKSWLKVSTEGVKKGDYVMVVGYPGSTNRYRLVDEIKNAFEWRYPTLHDLIAGWLKVIDESTADDKDAALKYAGLEAGLNNAMKNFEGMMEGYRKTHVLPRKQARQQALMNWVNADSDRRDKYGQSIKRLQSLVEESQEHRDRNLHFSLAQRSSLLRAAERLYRLAREHEKPDAQREPGFQKRDEPRIKEGLNRLERTFVPKVDEAVWTYFIKQYDKLPRNEHFPVFDQQLGLDAGKLDAAALKQRLDDMYQHTELTDPKVRVAWMDKSADAFRKSDDPFIKMAVALYDTRMQLENHNKTLDGKFQAARPDYMAAMIAYKHSKGEPVYPDANGTLRVTFGTVKGYSPRDAVQYEPFTTLRGVQEKNTGKPPFNSPDRLLKAIDAGHYGRYEMPSLHSVPVNFLSTVDTTGGNSGSPTLNGKGELVGLLFDGNYESIISDWDFNPAITRSIHVDLQYVLWLMDHVDHADKLLKEMDVKPESD